MELEEDAMIVTGCWGGETTQEVPVEKVGFSTLLWRIIRMLKVVEADGQFQRLLPSPAWRYAKPFTEADFTNAIDDCTIRRAVLGQVWTQIPSISESSLP